MDKEFQRNHRRCLAESGIHIASQHKEREVYRELVKEKVRIDAVSVKVKTSAGPTTKSFPLAVVPNLKAFVFSLLWDYDRHGLLTWHGKDNRAIPASRVLQVTPIWFTF